MGRLPLIEDHQFHELVGVSNSLFLRRTTDGPVEEKLSRQALKFHFLFFVFLQERDFTTENVHRDLVIKAQELYFQRKSCSEIAAALNDHVINEMFYKQTPPDKNRRKYFPSSKDIRNFVSRIRLIEKLNKENNLKIIEFVAKVQQEKTKVKILFTSSNEEDQYSLHDDLVEKTAADPKLSEISEDTQSENHLLLQPVKEVPIPESLSFLFCYQSYEQQRLLKRYSHVGFLTEISHSSDIRRTLTFKMYVMFVQTNVDYQAVGIIAHSKQNSEGLQDGLLALKNWNPGWTPKYLFVDPTEEMTLAAHHVFPGMCDVISIIIFSLVFSSNIRIFLKSF